MSSGFAEHRAKLEACKARAIVAGIAAVKAGQEPIAPYMIENAGFQDRTGNLRESFQQHDPTAEGTRITGIVSAGNALTLRDWHGGFGYETFIEFGTSTNTPPFHMMEDGTVAAMSGLGARMGAAFQEAF